MIFDSANVDLRAHRKN